MTFTPSLNVVEAMKQIIEHRITAAPVVDEANQLVGMLAEVGLMSVVIQDSYYNEPVGIVGSGGLPRPLGLSPRLTGLRESAR